MKEHADSDTQASIKKLLNMYQKIGFLINERFINIPAKISVPLLNSLYEEVERMSKKNPFYAFEYYIMICKTTRPKENSGNLYCLKFFYIFQYLLNIYINDFVGSEEIFSNDEEEVFYKAADVSFEFNVVNEADIGLGGRWLSEDKQVLPYRRILFFKAEKLKNIISQIATLVG